MRLSQRDGCPRIATLRCQKKLRGRQMSSLPGDNYGTSSSRKLCLLAPHASGFHRTRGQKFSAPHFQGGMSDRNRFLSPNLLHLGQPLGPRFMCDAPLIAICSAESGSKILCPFLGNYPFTVDYRLKVR